MKTPTIREISKACGLCPATVSRGLSNSPLLVEATRQRVLEAAHKLGWKPNPLVSIYMAHLSSTKKPGYQASLAYLIPYHDPSLYVDYFQLHFRGARARASSLGYNLETIWYRDLEHDPVRLTKLLKSRGIPGLILNGGDLPAACFEGFEWESFAAASWGFSLDSPVLHQAGYHHMQGMRLLFDKLEELEYDRIAMIISEDRDQLSDHTMLSTFSYRERCHSGKGWMRSYPLKSWFANRAEQKKIQAWLLKNKPQVVIGETVAWEAIRGLGWKVPRDVAFVPPNWSSVWPGNGGIDHMPELIGANSVDLVVNQLLRNERGLPKHPKLVLNEGRWVDGASVPPNRERQGLV